MILHWASGLEMGTGARFDPRATYVKVSLPIMDMTRYAIHARRL